ncbi:MAG: ComF family protein, partial [Candidatus Eiseniibacteriota bacterium]
LDAMLDRRCPGCAGRVTRDREVCAACDALVARTGTVLCLSCLHVDPSEPPALPGACPKHGSRRLALAGPSYEAPLDRIVRAFKFEGARRIGPWLSSLLPEPPGREVGLAREALVVPVPLHPARRSRRGFDQALLLAEDASLRWGIPLVSALRRVRDHEAQAGLDPALRRTNVAGAFVCATPTLVRGRAILLVDDVVTTGSTLLAAAEALEREEAAWILGIAAAHGGASGGPEHESQRAIAGAGPLW